LENISRPAKKIRHTRLRIFNREFHNYFSNGLNFCLSRF
jgi:hypothetical protein